MGQALNGGNTCLLHRVEDRGKRAWTSSGLRGARRKERWREGAVADYLERCADRKVDNEAMRRLMEDEGVLSKYIMKYSTRGGSNMSSSLTQERKRTISWRAEGVGWSVNKLWWQKPLRAPRGLWKRRKCERWDLCGSATLPWNIAGWIWVEDHRSCVCRWDCREDRRSRWDRWERTCACGQCLVRQGTRHDTWMTIVLGTQTCAILSLAALEPRVFAWWNVIMLCNSARAVFCGCTVHTPRRLAGVFSPGNRNLS